MRNAINHKPVTAHVFEYTTSFAIDPNLHFKYPDKGIVATQIIFYLKEKNQKKINSVRWFFNAFGSLLQVRTSCQEVLPAQVLKNSYSRIYAYSSVWVPDRDTRVFTSLETFDLNSNVGGACGEIAAYKGKNWSALLNPLGKSAT